jgi:hypothetical protein
MALPDPSQSSGIYIGVRGILGDEKNGSNLPAMNQLNGAHCADLYYQIR